MSTIEERIAGLSPEKRELLLQRLQAMQAVPDALPGRAAPEEGSRVRRHPLTDTQEQLWFLTQMERELGDAYHIVRAFHLNGALDTAALQRALEMMAARHEVLRTRIVMEGGQAWQEIEPPAPVTLTLEDVRQVSGADQTAQLRAALRSAVQRPFDLSQAPLWRACLFRLADERYVLLLVFHHIIFDGWSLGIFCEELGVCYRAIRRSAVPPLDPVPGRYVDVARAQGLATSTADLAYWQKQLAGAPPLFPFPTDHPRPASQTFRGTTERFRLAPSLTAALKALAVKEGATPYMLLLAAFQVLLSRYARFPDVTVGTPIANRRGTEKEALLGFFVNTLVLRTDLSGNPPFRAALRRVRDVALDAYDHQTLPFARLVKALQPARTLSHNPLYQIMFSLQSQPSPSLDLEDIAVAPFEVEREITQFDLSMVLEEREGGIAGELVYNTALFDRETIERLATHYVTLLTHIVTKPDQRINTIPILTPDEREQLITGWNQTALPCPAEERLHDPFERQARRTPQQPALIVGETTLTYQELNAAANRLAQYLRSRGVGPDTLVGVCMERSIDMVVALLAILKAGGAYVPLDPAYPAGRLAFILEDTRAPLLLVHRATQAKSPSVPLTATVVVDDLDLAAAADSDPHSEATAAHMAYVIYTSGSTGRPKGVMITHGNATAFLAWGRSVFPAPMLAGTLAATSICFDLSIFELFLPLGEGGMVILADNGLHLADLPAREQVTLVNTVPSVMAELVRREAIPASVRTVNLAGEPLARALVRQVYALPTVEHVYNLYGPTEDTTYSTYTLVERDGHSEPTIGRPIANSQAYILDDEFAPVPIGVSGDLYLGGDGVSRGYWNRPELTADRFLPDPFSPTPGRRLYKTGDLARYRADGSIEFLGRRDHQVKVRGFRIELGEIESTLLQHPEVQAAVVAVNDEQGDTPRLIAYVVPAAAMPAQASLQAFLRERLPDYMVPAHYVPLEALPLTPNGKIDRRALAALDIDVRDSEYVPPRTITERALVDIWKAILGIDHPIGVFDNFFLLGGHSINATVLMHNVETYFGVKLPIATIFEVPTLADLALRIDNHVTPSDHILVRMHPGSEEKTPFFVVHGASGSVFAAWHLGQVFEADRPIYGIQFQGLEGDAPFLTTIEAMARLYVDTIRARTPRGPYVFIGVSIGGVIGFEMARLLVDQYQEEVMLIMLDTRPPSYYPPYEIEWRASEKELLHTAFAQQLKIDPRSLDALTLEETINYYEEHLIKAGLQRETWDLRHVLLQYRTINQALTSYDYRPIDAPIYMLAASDETYLREWQAYTTRELHVITVEGEHSSMYEPPAVYNLAKVILKLWEQNYQDGGA